MAAQRLDVAYMSTLSPDIKEEVLEISSEYDFKSRSSVSPNKEILARYSTQTREEFARVSGTMVLYLRHEVPHVREAEEIAAMKALPEGYPVDQLNVLNVGAGGRRIRPQFICLDAFRPSHDDEPSGRHHVAMGDSVLSTLHSPPFRDESLDAILSLHSLEHDMEPIPTLLNWIKLLKPGGGIGLVLPDVRYTRSARRDRSEFGHKWDPDPGLIEQWFEKYLRDYVVLEKLNTYDYKISFDCVLRRPGEFKSFKQLTSSEYVSGRQLHELGRFPNDIY